MRTYLTQIVCVGGVCGYTLLLIVFTLFCRVYLHFLFGNAQRDELMLIESRFVFKLDIACIPHFRYCEIQYCCKTKKNNNDENNVVVWQLSYIVGNLF